VDSSNLQRNLYLVSQLIELGRPLVVALNMMDVAERRGLHVSAEKLQQKLGVPVVPIVGHKHKGISNLKSEIVNARVAPMPDWPLPAAMKEEVTLVGGGLAILDDESGIGFRVSGIGSDRSKSAALPETQNPRPETRRLEQYQAIAERLLIGDRADDISNLAGREPVASLLSHAAGRLG